jgi:hypothetical protein
MRPDRPRHQQSYSPPLHLETDRYTLRLHPVALLQLVGQTLDCNSGAVRLAVDIEAERLQLTKDNFLINPGLIIKVLVWTGTKQLLTLLAQIKLFDGVTTESLSIHK